nr:succinate:cytochrome c oxidoreductase subunit 3 [Phymatolithon calcareum]
MFKILNRPLSPHLTVYTSQFTSIYSIWHRLTGVFLIFVMVIFLLMCKVSSYIIFDFINISWNINLWLKNCVFLNCVLVFSYHLINGLRHISWDLGFNLRVNTVMHLSRINILVLFILTIFILQTINY